MSSEKTFRQWMSATVWRMTALSPKVILIGSATCDAKGRKAILDQSGVPNAYGCERSGCADTHLWAIEISRSLTRFFVATPSGFAGASTSTFLHELSA